MSAAAHSCRPAVAVASDRSTLKPDARRHRHVVGRSAEAADVIMILIMILILILIEAKLTPPAERMHPKAANLPFRPSTAVRQAGVSTSNAA